MKKIIFLMYLLLILIILLPQTEAGLFDQLFPNPIIRDLVVDIDSPHVIRTGNEFILITRIKNMNEGDNNVTVENIKILDSENRIIREVNPEREIEPIKEEIDYIKEKLNPNNPLQEQRIDNDEIQRINLKLNENVFKEKFILYIHDFDHSPEIGDTINIPLNIPKIGRRRFSRKTLRNYLFVLQFLTHQRPVSAL